MYKDSNGSQQFRYAYLHPEHTVDMKTMEEFLNKNEKIRSKVGSKHKKDKDPTRPYNTRMYIDNFSNPQAKDGVEYKVESIQWLDT